jgi:hypothetical protein
MPFSRQPPQQYLPRNLVSFSTCPLIRSVVFSEKPFAWEVAEILDANLLV